MSTLCHKPHSTSCWVFWVNDSSSCEVIKIENLQILCHKDHKVPEYEIFWKKRFFEQRCFVSVRCLLTNLTCVWNDFSDRPTHLHPSFVQATWFLRWVLSWKIRTVAFGKDSPHSLHWSLWDSTWCLYLFFSEKRYL